MKIFYEYLELMNLKIFSSSFNWLESTCRASLNLSDASTKCSQNKWINMINVYNTLCYLDLKMWFSLSYYSLLYIILLLYSDLTAPSFKSAWNSNRCWIFTSFSKVISLRYYFDFLFFTGCCAYWKIYHAFNYISNCVTMIYRHLFHTYYAVCA